MKKKITKFPSSKEIDSVLEQLEAAPASRTLPPNASAVDVLKFDLCEKFVLYRARKKVSQKELAARLGIDPALMSKILHYNYDEFTVDRLMRYLAELHKDVKVLVKVA